MSDIGNKAIFAKNLKYYMEHNQKTRKEMCRDLGVSYPQAGTKKAPNRLI